jgi:hypothetical protein
LAQPAEWYIVDLTRAVATLDEVDLEPRVPGRRAFVLSVEPVPSPLLVRENDGNLTLFLRSGSSSESAAGVKALAWNRLASRERLLSGIYTEFRTMVHQVRIAHGYNVRTGAGLPARLPLLVRSMEDGSFYRLLSESDIGELLGRRSTSRTGDTQGYLSRFLELEDVVRTTREGAVGRFHTADTAQREHWVIQQLSDAHRQLEFDLEAFRVWMVTQRLL